jgi:hypothetical protein
MMDGGGRDRRRTRKVTTSEKCFFERGEFQFGYGTGVTVKVGTQ